MPDINETHVISTTKFYEQYKPSDILVKEYQTVYITVIESDSSLSITRLRELVGSIHYSRNFNVSVPKIVVYGYLQSPKVIREIGLWRNVYYRDISEYIFPSTNSKNIIINNDILKITIIKLALKESPRVIFLDPAICFSKFKDKSSLQEVENRIDQSGFVMGTLKSSSKPFLIAFDYRVAPYVADLLIQKKLDCFRGFDCSQEQMDLVKEFPQKISKLGSNVPLNSLNLFATNPLVLAKSDSFCFIDFREDLMYNRLMILPSKVEEIKPRSSKRSIALLIPVLGKGVDGNVTQISLIRSFLPSFAKTVTSVEKETHRFTFYLGYDQDDEIYDSLEIRSEITNLAKVILAPLEFELIFVRLPFTNSWLTFIWNSLYIQAIRDGHDYYCQLNDDLIFKSHGWLSFLVRSLQKTNDIGVAGPSDPSWKCKLLTQVMVSRKHYEIFGWLYPVEIKDWFSDFWLTNIYGPDRTHCNQSVIVKNLRENGSRYHVCHKPRWKEALKQYQAGLSKYLNETIKV